MYIISCKASPVGRFGWNFSYYCIVFLLNSKKIQLSGLYEVNKDKTELSS